MNKEVKKYTFHVHGMHCNSCVVLTESELKDHALVDKVAANLKTCCVEVWGDFGDKSEEEVGKELSSIMEKHGYKISVEKEKKISKWSDFKIAGPLALIFIGLFVILQKLGIVNLIGSGEVSYGTAFLIGIVASLSTCMAVVGGLVLSISSNYAKEGEKFGPQMLFHASRLASFFILGGAIGALGSSFEIGAWGTFSLSFLVGVVMLILGLNLLEVLSFTKKIQPTLPKFFGQHLLEIKKFNHTLTPAILGVVTFFLPCGFTQAMQIYTLSTGTFINGAMTMFVFALGTLPVLALLSFSSFAIKDKISSGIFFKTAGIVVIFFALFNIINSLTSVGFLPPIINF